MFCAVASAIGLLKYPLQPEPRMRTFASSVLVAIAAAMATSTELANVRILGSGWSGYFNKPIAEATAQNIQKVGMPTWTDNDQTLAKAIQCEIGARQSGLSTAVNNAL